jgi:hypothetical protein
MAPDAEARGAVGGGAQLRPAFTHVTVMAGALS